MKQFVNGQTLSYDRYKWLYIGQDPNDRNYSYIVRKTEIRRVRTIDLHYCELGVDINQQKKYERQFIIIVGCILGMVLLGMISKLI